MLEREGEGELAQAEGRAVDGEGRAGGGEPRGHVEEVAFRGDDIPPAVVCLGVCAEALNVTSPSFHCTQLNQCRFSREHRALCPHAYQLTHSRGGSGAHPAMLQAHIRTRILSRCFFRSLWTWWFRSQALELALVLASFCNACFPFVHSPMLVVCVCPSVFVCLTACTRSIDV